MTWDLGIILPMIVYLCVMMPFRLCFENEPFFSSHMYWFEFVIDMVRGSFAVRPQARRLDTPTNLIPFLPVS